MNRSLILAKLPPFRGRYQLVTNRQTVHQIMRELLGAHKEFATHYDLIADDFYKPDLVEMFKDLFYFVKTNIRYNEEPEERQTITSPAGILALGQGDCKHYASFIGGVLDAVKRKYGGLDWWFRFSSYDSGLVDPGHVFVVAKVGADEFWIDPVLKRFNMRLKPVSYVDKFANIPKMALYKVSGINSYTAELEAWQSDDSELPAELVAAIQVLLRYGILDQRGRINDRLIEQLHKTLPRDQFLEIINARLALHKATISGLFSSIWRGVKKVSLAAPRNAFLSLVNFNVFGMATKLKTAIWDNKGNYTPIKEKVKKLWQQRFGGDWAVLEKTILRGASKQAVLGAAPAAVPAWLATASAIIAAIMPIINSFLKNRQQLPAGDPSAYPFGVCPDGVTARAPDGSCPPAPAAGGGGIIEWAKENPLPAAGLGVGVYYLLTKLL